jgi:redox-sensitive bicupin YhaK (pirin superfamily)
MLNIIHSESRGAADHGWLKAKHTFSFADYFDPARIQFGALRVINEDRVAPGQGFGTHPHRDMEIVTYVINGAIEHKDSMGNGTVIRAGEIQRMTAGTGVRHSEFNHSQDEELHLLQIWIFPEKQNLEPGYEQKLFTPEEKRNRLRLVGSRDGRDGSLTIHQDVELFASVLDTGHSVSIGDVEQRRVFVQVVSGRLDVNGEQLGAGDGLQIEGEAAVELAAIDEAEFLLFNLA